MFRKALPKVVCILAGAFSTLAPGQSFDLSWHTIDGGGATFGTGDAFQLGGTIGQPDASAFSTPMSGGGFTLVGGFWPAAGVVCTLPGDMNLDGQLDGVDVQPFTNCVIGINGSNCTCADLDGNGNANAADVGAFVNALLM